jgi:hypothetical protein
MIPDYPLAQMVSRQVNENRLDIDRNLAEALVNYDLKNNLDVDLKENYDIVNGYFKAFPELDHPPTIERMEQVFPDRFKE